MNDKFNSRILFFSNWFWNLYEFTDNSHFWDRGIVMSKKRGFWLHQTTDTVALKKAPRKHLLGFLQSYGYLIFLLKNIKYHSLLRKCAYTITSLRLCSAIPIHVTNTSSKKLVFFDFLEKTNLNYFLYNYIFFKKNNFKRYKSVRPTFHVFKGSDLVLTGSFDFSNISDENVIESSFVNESSGSVQLINTSVLNDDFINLHFLFDLFVLNVLEMYKIISICFFYKNFN